MALKVTAALCVILLSLLAGKVAKAEEAEKNLLPDKETCGRQNVISDMSVEKSAQLGEFPWLALLRYENVNGSTDGYRCVASLIGPRHLLTSCACATPTEVHISGVRMGDHDLTMEPDCIEGDENKCSGPTNDINVEKVIPHSKCSHETGDNDIALVKLNRPVEFADNIQPICLPDSATTTLKPGDTVTATGWGRSITGHLITVKKKVLSAVITNEECQKEYTEPKRDITENHLCTKSFRNNTAFTCMGDSGGPLMVKSGDQWQLVGIINFGRGCGYTFPDGHTRVEKYIDWIKENMLA